MSKEETKRLFDYGESDFMVDKPFAPCERSKEQIHDTPK
jgi:hypothetical protein